MVPVLSPFYGAQGIEEEKPVVKKAKKVEKVVKKESSEVIDSVENRLKNLSTLTLESQRKTSKLLKRELVSSNITWKMKIL